MFFWQQTGTKACTCRTRAAPRQSPTCSADQVDVSFQNVNAISRHVESGKLRPLAVTGQAGHRCCPACRRWTRPASALDVYSWQGVAAPKGLAPALKQQLAAAAIAAMNDPAVPTRPPDQGFEIVANTPAEFTAFQAKEFARWKNLIETRKITAD